MLSTCWALRLCWSLGLKGVVNLSVVLGRERVSAQVRGRALYHSGRAVDVLWMFRRQRPNSLDMCSSTTRHSPCMSTSGHPSTHEYCWSAMTDTQQETNNHRNPFCIVVHFRVKQNVGCRMRLDLIHWGLTGCWKVSLYDRWLRNKRWHQLKRHMWSELYFD